MLVILRRDGDGRSSQNSTPGGASQPSETEVAAFTLPPGSSCPYLRIAPGGKSIAAAVATEGKQCVLRDGAIVGKEYSLVGEPIFSPDGSSVAFVVDRGPQQLVIKNGTWYSQYYDEVSNIETTSDGSHFVFAARRGYTIYRVEAPC